MWGDVPAWGGDSEGYLYDNVGDNISTKRMSFCELTVQYWGWKNVKADYKGLMHYRRYLSFSDKTYKESSEERNNGCVTEPCLSPDFQKKYGLTTENCLEWLEKFDVIACHPISAGKSNIQCMKDSPDYHNFKDMEKALEILKNKYPAMSVIADEYMNSSEVRLYNCFVMRSDIFDEFCEWEFSILFELENHLNMDKYSLKKYRTPGTIGERLFGIYCLYLKKIKKIRFKETQLVFVEDPSPQVELLPHFGKDQVTLVCNFNNNYVKVFSVFLLSLISNLNPTRKYEIVVLIEDISEENQRILEKLVEAEENVKITFFNPFRKLNGLTLNVDNSVYTKDLYVRPLIPYILPNFDKVIVCDVDAIVKADLSQLFDIDLLGKPIGAVKDTVYYGYLNGVVPGTLEYAKNEMKLSDPYSYCNTGILVMDLFLIRKLYSEEQIKKKIDHSRYRVFEQDIINILFDKNIHFLDRSWNVFSYTSPFIKKCVEEAPLDDLLEYQKARKSPKIIHYAAHPKPWWTPSSDFGFEFWSYAKHSPFYEQLLGELSFHVSAGLLSEKNKKLGKSIVSLKKYFPVGSGRREKIKKLVRKWPRVKLFLKNFD